MKVSAVIAEYNPFHNGHKYMLEKVKENSDAAVIIMSGGFVQRGSIAVADKWTRARAALLNGADLVIELTESAEIIEILTYLRRGNVHFFA